MPRFAGIAAWVVVGLIVSAGVWLVIRPTPVPCDIVVIDRGPLVVTVDAEARTRLKDRYVVTAPLAGLAGRITLRPGDPVHTGVTVLVRISPGDPALLDKRSRSQAEARVRASEAAVARAGIEVARCAAVLEHAQSEFQRTLAAATLGGASVQEIEDQRIQMRTAEHAAESAHFALEMAEYELELSRAALLQHATTGRENGGSDQALEVRSPITGTVLRPLRVSAGAVFPGDPLVELGNLAGLEVEADVLSDQAVRVRAGQRVILARWGGDDPLEGVVRVVEPSGYTKISALGVEEHRVNVIIDFLDPPESRQTLGDNFRVEARIIVQELPDVVRVPVGALVRHRDGWAVYIVQSGAARLRSVTIGQRSDRLAEVLEGLAPGDGVIVYPSDRVADGAPVSPRLQ